MSKVIKRIWENDKELCRLFLVVLCFSFLENSRFVPSDKYKKFSVVQSMGIFTLAGTDFCRSNRKQQREWKGDV